MYHSHLQSCVVGSGDTGQLNICLVQHAATHNRDGSDSVRAADQAALRLKSDQARTRVLRIHNTGCCHGGVQPQHFDLAEQIMMSVLFEETVDCRHCASVMEW